MQRVEGLLDTTLLELALILQMKQFLAHRHARALMDLQWRGGSVSALRRFTLPDGYPFARLALHVLLPIHPPCADPSLLLERARSRVRARPPACQPCTPGVP